MLDLFFENKVFEKVDFSIKKLPRGEYDNCTFIDCIFSNSNLSNYSFIECEFNTCNLGLSEFKNTSLKDVNFKNCKLLGIHFHEVDEFLLALNFEECDLNLASFYKLKLKNIKFTNCKLIEVDFTEANLTNSVFNNCDLNGAIFERTILEKTDLRTSYNYAINPEINSIKKAKFSLQGLPGLLGKYNIEVEI